MDELIEKIKADAKENYIPIVRDLTIAKINEILKKESYKKVLEIGTATGYSSLLMLRENKDIKILTVEKDEERFEKAVKNFRQANMQNRVTAVLEDAINELARLCEEGEKFDFIFLDGPKGQYINYLPYLIKLINKSGTIFADNTLLGGLINQRQITHKHRAMVNKMKLFIEAVEKDGRLEFQKYDIDDGFMIIKLKNSTD